MHPLNFSACSVTCLRYAECSRAPDYIINGYGCPMQTISCTLRSVQFMAYSKFMALFGLDFIGYYFISSIIMFKVHGARSCPSVRTQPPRPLVHLHRPQPYHAIPYHVLTLPSNASSVLHVHHQMHPLYYMYTIMLPSNASSALHVHHHASIKCILCTTCTPSCFHQMHPLHYMYTIMLPSNASSVLHVHHHGALACSFKRRR